MRQETINIYTFDELSEKAQQKAIEWFLSDYPDYGWFDTIYEDAEQCGLEIMGFDIDRGNYCDMRLKTNSYYEDVAAYIIQNHGEHCETYKAAATFDSARIDAITSLEGEERGEPEDLPEYEEAENEFLYALKAAYLSMLRNEYDYLTSDEHAKEMIINNEYEFLEDGSRY